ncbi:MAG: type II secretion system protein [Candidatus Shapirobacteria bacterium]|jgi:hypothetical protein
MKTKNQRGQSVVELVFAMALLILFLTGAVVALLMAVGARGESLARKKAARLAEMVLEEKTGQKLNDPDNFWQLIPESGMEKTGFEKYSYSVGFSLVEDGTNYPTCKVSLRNCVDVKVMVSWDRGKDNALELKKFFGKGL